MALVVVRSTNPQVVVTNSVGSFMLLSLTLHVPWPPNAITESVAVVFEHTNVTKMLPLRLHQDTTARDTRDKRRARERDRENRIEEWKWKIKTTHSQLHVLACKLAQQLATNGMTFDLPFLTHPPKIIHNIQYPAKNICRFLSSSHPSLPHLHSTVRVSKSVASVWSTLALLFPKSNLTFSIFPTLLEKS